jgi:hypothetical protein
VKTYTLSSEDMDDRQIKVQDGQMIVYDVCKIKDYEGGDYVPRKAKEMDHVVLPIGVTDESIA